VGARCGSFAPAARNSHTRPKIISSASRIASQPPTSYIQQELDQAIVSTSGRDCGFGHEADPMALNFPNQSRSYDSTRRAVRFWGYDQSMEASFFVTEDALKRVQPDVRLDEAGLLRAYDTNRDLIYAAALKVYSRGRKGSYELLRGDFE
jgi:hypothetical protein